MTFANTTSFLLSGLCILAFILFPHRSKHINPSSAKLPVSQFYIIAFGGIYC